MILHVFMFVDKYAVCLCFLLDRVRVKYGVGKEDEGGADL